MRVKLGNYISEYSVKNKKSEDIPVYSVTNTQGFCQDYFGKEVASKDKSTYKIVPKGFFAYNPSRINVGSVDWQRNEERVIVSPLYNVFSVADEIDKQYLYYYLKSDIALQLIRTVATGSVRDNLKLDMLREFQIELPSLSKQKQIVYNLDKMNGVIKLFQQQLQKLDELVKSRFIELFGDVITNSKNWNISSWNESLKIVNGKNQKNVESETGDYLICGSGGPMGRATDYLTNENSVIVGRKGNINKPILMREKYWNVDTAFGIEPNKSIINVEYLYMFCLLFNFERLNKAVTIPSLTKADLLEIKMPIPPMELQQQFAAFVTQVDKSKLAVQQGLEKLETLKKSLMQQYFG